MYSRAAKDRHLAQVKAGFFKRKKAFRQKKVPSESIKWICAGNLEIILVPDDQIGPGRTAQFSIDVGQIDLDGPDREKQLCGDLLARLAVEHQPDDPTFPLGQERDPVFFAEPLCRSRLGNFRRRFGKLYRQQR